MLPLSRRCARAHAATPQIILRAITRDARRPRPPCFRFAAMRDERASPDARSYRVAPYRVCRRCRRHVPQSSRCAAAGRFTKRGHTVSLEARCTGRAHQQPPAFLSQFRRMTATPRRRAPVVYEPLHIQTVCRHEPASREGQDYRAKWPPSKYRHGVSRPESSAAAARPHTDSERPRAAQSRFFSSFPARLP